MATPFCRRTHLPGRGLLVLAAAVTRELAHAGLNLTHRMTNSSVVVDTFRGAILEEFDARNRLFPWRARRDPYAVLIGEVLLQRTRGENASVAYREFMRRWPTPERL